MSPRDLLVSVYPVLRLQVHTNHYAQLFTWVPGHNTGSILRTYTRLFFRGLTFPSGLTEEVYSDLFLVIRRNLTVRERKQVWGLCMIILPCFSIFLPYQCQLGKLRHRAANREAKVWVLEV